MCGICGIARLDGSSATAHREALEQMSATLAHRGPDSQGSAVDGPVALAARRLKIIDLEHGDQPLSNEDGRVTVVQNGEILQLPRAAPGARGRRPQVSQRGRHRGPRPPLRGAWPRLRRAPPRDVRDRDLGRAPQPARARPRSFRNQAARLLARRAAARLRLRPEGAAPGARLPRRGRPRGARRVSGAELGARPADDPPRGAQARRRSPADLGTRRGHRPSAATRARARSTRPTCATRTTRRSRRSCSLACATRSPRT